MSVIRTQIVNNLTGALNPTHLEVVDESHMHSRRTPENPETHFKIVIVSAQFAGLRPVQRQQRVYSILQPLFSNGLHALSQSTFTPEEWQRRPVVPESPNCAGHKQNH